MSLQTTLLLNRQLSPIYSISPYYSTWVIRALVINKTPIRYYSGTKPKTGWKTTRERKGKSSKHIIMFDVCDEKDMIRFVAYDDQAFRIEKAIKKGQVYRILNGSPQKAYFESYLKNDFEVVITDKTIIETYADHLPNLIAKRINPTSLGSLAMKRNNTVVDICGAIRCIYPVLKYRNPQNGRQDITREIWVADDTYHEAKLVLFGKRAEEFDAERGDILCGKDILFETSPDETRLLAKDHSFLDVNMTEVLVVANLRKWWTDKSNLNKSFMPICYQEQFPCKKRRLE